jgi:hypothetical protein
MEKLTDQMMTDNLVTNNEEDEEIQPIDHKPKENGQIYGSVQHRFLITSSWIQKKSPDQAVSENFMKGA